MRHYFPYIITVVMLVLSMNGNAKEQMTYKGGEKLVYEVYFNIGFLYFNVAKAVMEVETTEYNGKKAYKLQINANTHKGYGENTLNDTLTAYIDKETLKPLHMTQATHENKYHAWNIYNYSYTDSLTKCNITRKRAKGDAHQKVSDNKPYYDVVSFVYHLRNTINPDKLTENQKVSNRLVLDDGIYPLYWRYAGMERIKLRDKSVYDCLKIKPAFVDSQLFEDGEMMTLYLSDDKNKIPIMIEAKLKIGSIKAYLVESNNLLYPLKSKIK